MVITILFVGHFLRLDLSEMIVALFTRSDADFSRRFYLFFKGKIPGDGLTTNRAVLGPMPCEG